VSLTYAFLKSIVIHKEHRHVDREMREKKKKKCYLDNVVLNEM